MAPPGAAGSASVEAARRRPWLPAGAPIRVGLVGLGNVGLGHHVPALLANADLVRVVAVADPSEERRRLAAAALGLPDGDLYATAEDLFARADLDLVDLATPPNIRTSLALRALATGRAILCEKPIATSPADGAAIVAASAASGVPTAMIHNYVALPEIIAARTAIEVGAIGRPEVAILNYLGVEDRPGSAAWQPDWRHDASVAGGGVLMDMLHVVYVAEALLGQEFRAVSAEVLGRTSGAAVEELALCRFEADDAVALINVGWGVGPGGISIAGRDGRIDIRYVGGGTGPFAALESVTLTRRGGLVEDLTPPLPPPDQPLDVRFAETFRACFERLAAGRTPPATAGDGVRVLEATLAAYASAATGRTVGLPLAPGDPVCERGVAGLADLDVIPERSIARRGLFGVTGRG